jgi:hypothetical protein
MYTHEDVTPVIRAGSSSDYDHNTLPSAPSFRVVELLPGNDGDISCKLHTVLLEADLEYEAISYAWGDTNSTALVFCDGKPFEVTKNLSTALTHLRYEDRSRFLWTDALW